MKYEYEIRNGRGLFGSAKSCCFEVKRQKFSWLTYSRDSLSILVTEIKDAKAAIVAGAGEEAQEILTYILERLTDRLNIYTEALKAHNLELPFTENKA